MLQPLEVIMDPEFIENTQMAEWWIQLQQARYTQPVGILPAWRTKVVQQHADPTALS